MGRICEILFFAAFVKASPQDEHGVERPALSQGCGGHDIISEIHFCFCDSRTHGGEDCRRLSSRVPPCSLKSSLASLRPIISAHKVLKPEKKGEAGFEFVTNWT